MENEINRYFREVQSDEQENLKWQWIIDRLVEVACLSMIVFAVALIMMTMAGAP